ncbi:MAG: type II toxin-antitoxin system VapC family toxin [Bacteroidota bacterium]
MKYLLDTDICIYYLKGLHNIDQRIKSAGLSTCCISEITVAELKFGAANSAQRDKNVQVIQAFIDLIQVIPIYDCLDFYADEKSRLRKNGTPLDEFDLIIGSCAVYYEMILVTNNEKHFSRINGIRIENWTQQTIDPNEK